MKLIRLKVTDKGALMLFLNKQKREETKMFDELTRKVKDSKKIDKAASTYDLIYKLDSIDIAFNVGENF